jgi:hypothetical protein
VAANTLAVLCPRAVCCFLLSVASDGAAAGFRYFWLTDSCPQTVDAVKDRKPFEVLTLAGPIADALQI